MEISFEWGSIRINIRTFIIVNIYQCHNGNDLDDNITSNVLEFADDTIFFIEKLTLMVLNNKTI